MCNGCSECRDHYTVIKGVDCGTVDDHLYNANWTALEDSTSNPWQPHNDEDETVCKDKCSASQMCLGFVWRPDSRKCWFLRDLKAGEFKLDPTAHCYAYTREWCKHSFWLRSRAKRLFLKRLFLATYLRDARAKGVKRF